MLARTSQGSRELHPDVSSSRRPPSQWDQRLQRPARLSRRPRSRTRGSIPCTSCTSDV